MSTYPAVSLSYYPGLQEFVDSVKAGIDAFVAEQPDGLYPNTLYVTMLVYDILLRVGDTHMTELLGLRVQPYLREGIMDFGTHDFIRFRVAWEPQRQTEEFKQWYAKTQPPDKTLTEGQPIDTSKLTWKPLGVIAECVTTDCGSVPADVRWPKLEAGCV